jgi:hypothetical protein
MLVMNIPSTEFFSCSTSWETKGGKLKILEARKWMLGCNTTDGVK